MIPLLLAVDADAVPYGQVATIVGAMSAAILALCTVVGVLWKRDVKRETDRTAREKEMAALARSDGVELTRALAATSERMEKLVAKIEQSDEQRSAIGSEMLREIEKLREKMDEVLDTIEKCNR